jgi:ubiquinone/menaquinone biosynthesis C-methylase UbiE
MQRNSGIHGISRRVDYLKAHPVWGAQYEVFRKTVSRLDLPAGSTALSVSCGDGTWDYLAFAGNPAITRMIATDVVDCQVNEDDIHLLNNNGQWSFLWVAPDSELPVSDECCDFVMHLDVIEHTTRPYLLLRENFRALKPGGYLLCGTPNLFRPANVLKLLCGRLHFPWRLATGLLNPAYLNPGVRSEDMVHVQEFNQYQLRIMLEEVGFEEVSVTACFFGISFLKLKVCDFPVGNVGRHLCQYLFCLARKPG